MLVTLFGAATAILAGVAAYPQAVRARRSIEGLSPTAAAGAAVSMLWWVSYTLGEHDWWAFTASVAAGLAWAYVLVVIAHRRRDTLHLDAVAAVVAALGVASGHPGVLASAAGVVWAVPQLVVALRQQDLTGVSTATWLLLVAENTAWVSYGALTHRWVYVPPSAWQLLCAAVIVTRVYTAHRRSRGPR